MLGHSLGAITTLTMAGLYPDLARAILLEDPAPFWMPRRTSADGTDPSSGLLRWIASNKRKTHADLLNELEHSSPTLAGRRVGSVDRFQASL